MVRFHLVQRDGLHMKDTICVGSYPFDIRLDREDIAWIPLPHHLPLPQIQLQGYAVF